MTKHGHPSGSSPETPAPAGEGGLAGSAHNQRPIGESELEVLAARASADPGSVDARLALASGLAAAGRYEEAAIAYEACAALDASNVRARAELGRMLMNIGQHARAQEQLRGAVALDPGCAQAHADLCWSLRRLGFASEAVEAGTRAAELTDSPEAKYYLAFALLASDRPKDAIALCDRMLEQQPQDVRAIALKVTALDGIGNRPAGRRLADFERLLAVGTIGAPMGYSDLAAFNRALVEQVLSFPGRPGDDTQTVDLFAEPKGAAAALAGLIDDAIRQYLDAIPRVESHPFLSFRPSRWVLDGWGTRLLSTPDQEHHFHQHGWVSGVYYVRLPPFVGTQSAGTSGSLEFCRFHQYGERPVESEFVVLPPKEGMMVLFPSYFYHRVCPFEHHEARVSIAFNAAIA